MSKVIGETIKRLRKERGLTQTEVAEKLFMSPQNISRVESGDGEPTVEMLMQISELFNVSIDTLVGRNTLSKGEILRFTENYFKDATANEVSERIFDIFRSVLSGRFKAFAGEDCYISKSTYSTLVTPDFNAFYADRDDCPKMFLALHSDEFALNDSEASELSHLFGAMADKNVLAILPVLNEVSKTHKHFDKGSLCKALGISIAQADDIFPALQNAGCLTTEKLFLDGSEITLYTPGMSKRTQALLAVAKLLYLRKTDGNAR